MTEVKYKSSNNQEFNLIGDKMRPTAGYFHEYEWNPNATAVVLGDSVNGFSKESKTYTLTLTLRGEKDDQKKTLDHLTNCFEHDVINLKPGRFYFGSYYIDAYVIGMKNTVSETLVGRTDCEIDIYCPYPFWSEEQKKDFYPDTANKSSEYTFLDYPFDFKYDYSARVAGSDRWYIDHYRSSNFKMIIYGPCANPRITINDHVYQIYDTLEASEYILIESRNKTVTKHLLNGTVQNIFAKRRKESSVFELIPSGDLSVNWSGTFGFEITVFKERSVPRWI